MTLVTNETGEYTLYVPYLDNSKLRSDLEIISGDGKIDFITVNKTLIENKSSNKALKITGLGNIKIHGKTQDHKWCEMSLNAGEVMKRTYAYWVWCNKTNSNQNISISIKASVSDFWSCNYWQTKSYERTKIEFIKNGWNKINMELENIVV